MSNIVIISYMTTHNNIVNIYNNTDNIIDRVRSLLIYYSLKRNT